MPVGDEQRREITFSQAEGLAELPRPLNLGEMPDAFRVALWSEIYSTMKPEIQYDDEIPLWFSQTWDDIICSLWIKCLQLPIDEMPIDPIGLLCEFKSVITDQPYARKYSCRRVCC